MAADLIAQAEHDEDATAWCVTTDLQLADAAAGGARGGARPRPAGRDRPERRWSGTGS